MGNDNFFQNITDPDTMKLIQESITDSLELTYIQPKIFTKIPFAFIHYIPPELLINIPYCQMIYKKLMIHYAYFDPTTKILYTAKDLKNLPIELSSQSNGIIINVVAFPIQYKDILIQYANPNIHRLELHWKKPFQKSDIHYDPDVLAEINRFYGFCKGVVFRSLL